MPTLRKSRRSVEDLVRTELKQIRAHVAEVSGSESARPSRALPRRRPATP